jgi:5-methylcytosine-specific restriction enzyme A
MAGTSAAGAISSAEAVGRITFRSAWCVDEWKLRTDPGYLRDRVFERDCGVCARCGIDCVAELMKLKHSRGRKRLAAWSQWSLKPGLRRSLWDADHIVQVVEGGPLQSKTRLYRFNKM